MFEVDAQIRLVELRRLGELRKQAAQYGPHTDPAVLIEIQDLLNKYPEEKRASMRHDVRLDYDFLMNVMAATLQRFNIHEETYKRDQRNRITRQFIQTVWMIIITVIVMMNLLLLLAR